MCVHVHVHVQVHVHVCVCMCMHTHYVHACVRMQRCVGTFVCWHWSLCIRANLSSKILHTRFLVKYFTLVSL